MCPCPRRRDATKGVGIQNGQRLRAVSAGTCTRGAHGGLSACGARVHAMRVGVCKRAHARARVCTQALAMHTYHNPDPEPVLYVPMYVHVWHQHACAGGHHSKHNGARCRTTTMRRKLREESITRTPLHHTLREFAGVVRNAREFGLGRAP